MAPKIAIIGAGPGGCMLARLLFTQCDCSTTIFEAEASINYRSQGGTLDLRANTGLAAIQLAGMWDEFQKYARYDGESLLLTDKYLTTWIRRGGRKTANAKVSSGDAPEIDRADLRKILMESLPRDTVRWGYKLSRVEECSTGLSLHFANGEVLDGFDLIVGCDGAFSKTRNLLTPEKPYYAGLGGWTMYIPDAANAAPDVYELVNRGSVFAYSDGKILSIQQLSDDSLYVSYYGPHPEDFTQTCDFDAQNDIEAAKVVLKKELHGWAPELFDAVEKATTGLVWRNLYQLPVGFTWPHRPGVTLMGDAAHVMTPFAGIGVNTAFHDAMVLTKQIVAYTSSTSAGQGVNQVEALGPYIERYEREMFTHAHAAQRRTEGVKNASLFTPGAPRTSIETCVLWLAEDEVPGWCRPLLAVVVYVGYWVYKLFV
jgi:2-polyprenyl-6-methoxyphenol hydroxylase-like FAD-dependent oxidoreductase